MDNQIIKGNCFDIIKNFPDGSFDAIITDPPYGINLSHWDKPVDIPTFTSEVKRLLDDGFYAFFGQMPTVIDWINEANNHNLKHKEHIVWVKRKQVPTGRLHKSHESIYIYSKKRSKFYQTKGYYEDVKLPCLTTGVITFNAIDRYINSLWMKVEGKSDEVILMDKKGQQEYKRLKFDSDRSPRKANFTNVWSFLPPHRTHGRAYKEIYFHPTEKPLELIKRLVEMLTPENGLILDPFAGSGTLAIACLETGRRYVCIEQEDDYFEVMQKRISQWHNDQLNKSGTYKLPDDIERINEDNNGQLNLF